MAEFGEQLPGDRQRHAGVLPAPPEGEVAQAQDRDTGADAPTAIHAPGRERPVEGAPTGASDAAPRRP